MNIPVRELRKKAIIYLAFLRLKVLLLLSSPQQGKIAKIKTYQKVEYEKLKKDFLTHYNRNQHVNIDKYVTSLWGNYSGQLKKNFFPYPRFFFLQNPIVARTMFLTRGGAWSKQELDFLENRLDKSSLNEILMEDYVGGALISDKKNLTSYTSIHHLYHFMEFFDKTKVNIKDINTVVEWGGGYGNAAKIFKRLKSKPVTYILIDIPLLCSLQWIYLATIFGKKEVNFIDSSGGKIEKNKINILPVSFVDKYKIKGDLFISTWALSESSKYSQDYVLKENWFSCPHLLLAFQGNNYWLPDAGRVKKIAEDAGCLVEDIVFLKNNYYAFR